MAALLCRFDEMEISAAFNMLHHQGLICRAPYNTTPIKFRLTPNFHLGATNTPYMPTPFLTSSLKVIPRFRVLGIGFRV